MGSLMTRDERETRIDESADRLAYLVVSYGLLVIVAYRGLVEGATSWDLLGLVVLGGLVSLAHRVGHRAVSGRGVAVLAMTVFVAALLAGLLVLMRA
jgi:hypothetical protein